MLAFLKQRLVERSTWRGIVMFVTAMGISLDPLHVEAIIAAGVAVGGILEAFLPDPAGRVT